MDGEFAYLVQDDPDGTPAAPIDRPEQRPPLPVRRPFVGSGRFFALFVVAGLVAGLAAEAALSVARGGPGLVWTERALTWMSMLFAVLGALAGAVAAVVVDAAVHRARGTGG